VSDCASVGSVTRSVRAVAYLTLLSSAGCLLFSDPINTAPTVSLSCTQEAFSTVCAQGQEPPSFFRQANVQFQATVSDPNQDASTLELAWYVTQDCEPVPSGLAAGPKVGLTQFPFLPTDLGHVCVTAVVTDRQGASAKASRDFEVVDQPPVAGLDVVPTAGLVLPEPGQPLMLPLFAKVTFTGAGSKDPDDDPNQLTYGWSVYSGTTQLSMPGCPDPGKPHLCTFTAASAGDYRVQLVVFDPYPSFKRSDPPAEQAIRVATDQLPNIVLDLAQPSPPTSLNDAPLQLLAGFDNSFSINRVEDDGDPFPSSDPARPYPTPPAGFLWSYQTGTDPSFHRLIGETGPYFTLRADPSDAFWPQDSIRLRVEYHDRVTACQPKTAGCDAVFRACDPSAVICYSQDLRVQWVTWSVVFR
jgi:hypothetical protein